jgi:RNA polymerase sigma-70 factor (ECF subfamily)
LKKFSTRARGEATAPLGSEMIAILPGPCAPRVSASPVNTLLELCSSGNPPKHAKPHAFGTDLSDTTKQGKTRLPKSQGFCLDEVIRLAQRGDSRAFEAIYRFHSPRVYALCLRLVRDPVEAEDFAQEVFLQLFRKIHTFRGESAFSSWLYRLTANLVFMKFRKKKLTMNSLESFIDTENEGARLEREIGFTDLQLSGLFDRFNLRAAIKLLPEGYKAMFLLHDVHGYEHNEIAKMFGCSVGNSKSQLHKARKRLREVLRGLDSGPE